MKKKNMQVRWWRRSWAGTYDRYVVGASFLLWGSGSKQRWCLYDTGLVGALWREICLAVMWECFEVRVGIRETLANRAADSALPLLGFSLMYHVFQTASLAEGHASMVLFVSLFVFVLVNYASWEARVNGDRDFQS